MIVRQILEPIEPRRRRGIVCAAGGSADIILAQTIAAGLIRQGCSRVDLAQPLNCGGLSGKGLLSDAGTFQAPESEDDLDAGSVLRHHASIPAGRRRGRGLSLSSSLAWTTARGTCALRMAEGLPRLPDGAAGTPRTTASPLEWTALEWTAALTSSLMAATSSIARSSRGSVRAGHRFVPCC